MDDDDARRHLTEQSAPDDWAALEDARARMRDAVAYASKLRAEADDLIAESDARLAPARLGKRRNRRGTSCPGTS